VFAQRGLCHNSNGLGLSRASTSLKGGAAQKTWMPEQDPAMTKDEAAAQNEAVFKISALQRRNSSARLAGDRLDAVVDINVLVWRRDGQVHRRELSGGQLILLRARRGVNRGARRVRIVRVHARAILRGTLATLEVRPFFCDGSICRSRRRHLLSGCIRFSSPRLSAIGCAECVGWRRGARSDRLCGVLIALRRRPQTVSGPLSCAWR